MQAAHAHEGEELHHAPKARSVRFARQDEELLAAGEEDGEGRQARLYVVLVYAGLVEPHEEVFGRDVTGSGTSKFEAVAPGEAHPSSQIPPPGRTIRGARGISTKDPSKPTKQACAKGASVSSSLVSSLSSELSARARDVELGKDEPQASAEVKTGRGPGPVRKAGPDRAIRTHSIFCPRKNREIPRDHANSAGTVYE